MRTFADKGKSAVFGDAERSAIDEPPTHRAGVAEKNQPDPGLVVITDDEGKSYVEDAGPTKE